MLTVTIETDNAAFDDNTAAECARLLREAADCLDAGRVAGTLRDGSGNKVGKFYWSRSPAAPAPSVQRADQETRAALANDALRALHDEALRAWADQFDGPEDEDLSVSGADLVDWFTDWRQRLRAVLDAAKR